MFFVISEDDIKNVLINNTDLPDGGLISLKNPIDFKIRVIKSTLSIMYNHIKTVQLFRKHFLNIDNSTGYYEHYTLIDIKFKYIAYNIVIFNLKCNEIYLVDHCNYICEMMETWILLL